jgi:uncharacterized phage protein (TIGR01671 family)
MREIKFRGIDEITNQWIYGNLVDSGLVKKKSFYILKEDVDSYDEIEKVFAESVGQFTGLKDKDRVEVYEGDIFENGWVVSFKNGMFGIFNYGMHMAINAYMCQYREVVGNIYENPELLAVPTAVL